MMRYSDFRTVCNSVRGRHVGQSWALLLSLVPERRAAALVQITDTNGPVQNQYFDPPQF
jgi:hypothetical protein